MASGHQKRVTILFKLYRGMVTRQRQPICNVLVVDVYLMQCSRASFQFCVLSKSNLKGLSQEIDFKNVDENGQILALTRAAAGF